MLEDCSVMEKKPNGRSAQPPPKGGVTENKKNLDTTSKPFGKYSRRREPAGYYNTKNEPPRKCNPSKGGKFSDKRPKPRNQYYSCGKEDSKVAEHEGPEYGSVFVPGSKKQNLNHLLNFHYAPRVTSGNYGSWIKTAPQNWFATQKHKYNKEHFLQANCQFVVKEDADYTPHFVDPDLLVDWSRIEQIRLQTGALVSCPICLDTPVASKITRCGHVFCWSCILHYLALSDKTWRKCPICYEAVHKNDLKSVITLAYSPYNVNGDITFKLMKRERGSLLPIPVEESHRKPITGLLSLTETEIDTIYSKLLLAKPQDVMSMIQLERMELKAQLQNNEDCPEVCFIEQALELLNEREESVKKSLEERKEEGYEAKKNENTVEIENELSFEFNSTLLLHEENESSRTRHESASSEGGTTSEEDHPNIAAEDLEIINNTTSKPFYFYQASDGQHVYLHALNIKMLEMQYGSLENCPLQVQGKIIEKEVGSMTEGLRKRLRYLQHLPLTCQFEVAEVNLSAYISDEVLENFKNQIEARIRRRNRRAREERLREKKINEEVNLKWGRQPTPRLRIESHRQFPLCGSGSDEVLSVVPASPPESNVVSRSQSLNSLSSISTTLDSVVDGNSSNQFVTSSSFEYSGPSFAQMLKEGTSHTSKSGCWGTSAPKSEPKPQAYDSESELDGYVPVPQFRQSFSDAIAVALEKAEKVQEDTSNRKKKKKKQKILFVTGMACSAK